jgi:hypothetical protein
MDPYIEVQAAWPSFHNRLIAEICNELGTKLPDSYIASVDERIEVAADEPSETRSYRPDVLIARFDAPSTSSGTATAIATLEPQLVEVTNKDPEEYRITWVEIRALPDLDLVTAIEVLSPINKIGQVRQNYLDKRDKLHASKINLVEIDLLLAGAPLPMKPRIHPGDYYAIVARGSSLPQANLYRWTVRDPIPSLPIPLRDPDPDIFIDLPTLVTRVYDSGRYPKILHHTHPLPDQFPLSAEDRDWIQSR